MKKKIVFVGLSGGVDSAVSATLLKKQGYEVVGVFIKTWHPEFLVCNEEEERMDAMRVSAVLDIPFLTFDFEEVYKKEVADYMIREYKLGHTPNPDVMCNKEVKFGAFLKKALSMGADFVATGHYAQSFASNIFLRPPAKATSAFEKHYLQSLKDYKVGNTFLNGDVAKQDIPEKKNFLFCKSKDPSKDQSYFLWTLKQEQLKKIIFPIGGLKKSEVRKLARKFKLPVSEKKDSQGICFLGQVDLKEFLKHYIKEKKGKVLNEKGEEIGYHNGAVFYTLGERHGFTITKKTPTDGAYYVVSKDIKKNILYVSQKFPRLNKAGEGGGNSKNHHPAFGTPPRKGGEIQIRDTNWIFEIPELNKNYTAQIRYHGEFLSCQIKSVTLDVAQVIFEKPILVASGQSCVIYDGAICLGGGVVV